MEVCVAAFPIIKANSGKSPEQKFIFQIGPLNPLGINEVFSFDKFIFVFLVTMFPLIA